MISYAYMDITHNDIKSEQYMFSRGYYMIYMWSSHTELFDLLNQATSKDNNSLYRSGLSDNVMIVKEIKFHKELHQFHYFDKLMFNLNQLGMLRALT